jgi:hypothetical protein
MKNTLTTKYWFSQIVYLVHCPEQLPRMVVDINFEGGPNKIVYCLACGSDRSLHYEAELSAEQDQIIAMGVFKDSDRN